MKLQKTIGVPLKPARRQEVSARRQEVSAQTRFLDFPWGSNVGWSLREMGVRVTGIDYLDGHYVGGTPASTTHLLYFILRGKVTCNYGTGEGELSEGHWAICPAQGPHWIRHQHGQTEALWVHLLDTPQWRFFREQGPGIFKIHNPDRLRESLVQAIQEASNGEHGAFDCAQSFATIFRIGLTREIDRAFHRQQSPLRSRLTELWAKVNDRLDEEWTVERLAAELHVSSSALYLNVAEQHRVKPMQMVTQLRIERAKDLLLHSDLKLESVAQAIGYQTPFSFSDAFQRETGVRPGQFRKARLNS